MDTYIVRIWDVTERETCRLVGHTSPINSIHWSTDGAWLVTGSDDYTARIWDPETCHEVQRFMGHSDSVNSVAWSPDGHRIVTASDDQTARIWPVRIGDSV